MGEINKKFDESGSVRKLKNFCKRQFPEIKETRVFIIAL